MGLGHVEHQHADRQPKPDSKKYLFSFWLFACPGRLFLFPPPGKGRSRNSPPARGESFEPSETPRLRGHGPEAHAGRGGDGAPGHQLAVREAGGCRGGARGPGPGFRSGRSGPVRCGLRVVRWGWIRWVFLLQFSLTLGDLDSRDVSEGWSKFAWALGCLVAPFAPGNNN